MIRKRHSSDSYLLNVLRSQRQLRNLSQSELGSLLGMPQSHIARIETGVSDVRLSTLTQIARALDLEPMFIPRHLVSAVQYLIQPPAQSSPESSPKSSRLVGNSPDEPDDEHAGDNLSF